MLSVCPDVLIELYVQPLLRQYIQLLKINQDARSIMLERKPIHNKRDEFRPNKTLYTENNFQELFMTKKLKDEAEPVL